MVGSEGAFEYIQPSVLKGKGSMRLLAGVLIACASLNVYASECGSIFESKDSSDKKQNREELSSQEKVDAINNGVYDAAFDGKLKAEFVPDFNTIRQFPASGRIPADAKVRVLLSHGAGATYSHSDAMRSLIRSLGEEKGLAKPSSNISKIREYDKFTKVAIEAIDLPFHGKGSRDASLHDKEAVTAYLTRYLKQMKAETPHLPIVVFGRSSSPSLYIDILSREPNLIDGVINMSPVIPLTREIVTEGTQKAYEMAAQGSFAIHKEGLDWVDNLLLQTNWNEKSLNGKPALFLTGKEDWEVTTLERNFMAKLAQDQSNVRYIDLPGAGHDVFRETKINNDKQVLETLKAVEDFLFEIANTKK